MYCLSFVHGSQRHNTNTLLFHPSYNSELHLLWLFLSHLSNTGTVQTVHTDSSPNQQTLTLNQTNQHRLFTKPTNTTLHQTNQHQLFTRPTNTNYSPNQHRLFTKPTSTNSSPNQPTPIVHQTNQHQLFTKTTSDSHQTTNTTNTVRKLEKAGWLPKSRLNRLSRACDLNRGFWLVRTTFPYMVRQHSQMIVPQLVAKWWSSRSITSDFLFQILALWSLRPVVCNTGPGREQGNTMRSS